MYISAAERDKLQDPGLNTRGDHNRFFLKRELLQMIPEEILRDNFIVT